MPALESAGIHGPAAHARTREPQIVLTWTVLSLLAAAAVGAALRGGTLVWPALACGGAILLAALDTRLTLIVILGLVPWQIYLGNWPGSSYSFRLADLLIASASVATLVRVPGAFRMLTSRRVAPLLGFVALGVLVGVGRGDYYAAAKLTADWSISLAFYWLFLVWLPRVKGDVLLWSLLATYGLQSILGIVQAIVGDPDTVLGYLGHPAAQVFFDPDLLAPRLEDGSVNFIWQDRVFAFGTYLSSAGLGITLGAVATLGWGVWSRKSFRFAVVALSTVGCLLVLKRSGWITLSAGLATLAMLRSNLGRQGRRRLIVSMILIVLAACALGYWQRDTILDRVGDQFGWEFGRENIWRIYLTIMAQQPILGYGPAYPQGTEATGLEATTDYSFGPENTYMHVVLTAGVLGLIGFLTPVVICLSELWRARTTHRPLVIGTLAALIGLLIGSMFIVTTGDLQSGGVLFFLLALGHHAARTAELQKASRV